MQAGVERDGARTVTVFRVLDSETPGTTLAERRRRRRERGMNARWVAAELERACADEASASGRGPAEAAPGEPVESQVHCARRRRPWPFPCWGALDVKPVNFNFRFCVSVLLEGKFPS